MDSYVAFMDIMGFSVLADRSDDDPEWRAFLADSVRLLRTTLPATMEHGDFRVSQFSDCVVISAARSDQALFTVLMAASRLAASLFDRGLLMRGGIARGGFVHDDTIMFGPALVRAHAFDEAGAPPHVVLHSDVVSDVEASPYRETLSRWIVVDPWDMSPIVHTLERFGSYPQAGDLVIADDARAYADHIRAHVADRSLKPRVRAKWRWMQDYWNRTVAARGMLVTSD